MKALIVFVLLRVFGLSWGRSAEGGLLLGQGGGFAFIVIGMALTLGLLERQVGQFMLIVVGVSMLAAPGGRSPRAEPGRPASTDASRRQPGRRTMPSSASSAGM